VRRVDGQRAGFLHTSPEYAMKRLLCAGAPDIYQVAHVFREGERGRRHNPEFTMIEWYRLGMDHFALMRGVDGCLRALLEPQRPVGPTVHVTYAEACEAALGVNPLAATADEIEASLDRAGLDVPPGLHGDRDGLLDLGMSLHVTARFPEDRITFVRDFPASQAALARISGRSPLASKPSGVHSSSRTDSTSSAMRKSRRNALHPTPPPAANEHNQPGTSTSTSWRRSQLACRPARAWRSGSTAS